VGQEGIACGALSLFSQGGDSSSVGSFAGVLFQAVYRGSLGLPPEVPQGVEGGAPRKRDSEHGVGDCG